MVLFEDITVKYTLWLRGYSRVVDDSKYRIAAYCWYGVADFRCQLMLIEKSNETVYYDHQLGIVQGQARGGK